MKSESEIIFLKKENSFSKKIFFLLFVLSCFLLTKADAQLTIFLQAQNPQCGGFATGSIQAIVAGGMAPYTFLWSNGSTNNPITNLPVGTYTVTVTDSQGTTGTASATLTSPPALLVEIEVTECSIPGAMFANVTGGISPYTYSWNTGATTPGISNLGQGEYCVTIFDSNNCGYITCEEIGSNLTVNVNTTPASCGSGMGGTATATPIGGTPPYTYLWSNDSTSQTIQDLIPGFYTVTVTANNGCTFAAGGSVGILSGTLPIMLDVTHPACQGSATGSITATASSGVGTLNFLWSNGDTTQTASNLIAGVYTVTVSDALSCSGTQSATLQYQSNMSASVTAVNPTCSNSSNGSLSANPSGGLPPYSFLWSNGSTSPSVSNLPAGNYSVTITDSLNCNVIKTATLTAPPAMTVSITTTNATQCGASNGSVSAMPSGSQPPYSYVWNNGGTSNIQNNIPAGVYTVTVTSSLGCTATGTGTVSQPTTLNVSISGSTSVCSGANNGTLTANPPPNTGPYTYHWSNGATTKTISNLSAGAYTVSVSNTQGCQGTASATISSNPDIIVNLSVMNAKCYNSPTGEISASASGGTPPFSYLWSNGATTAIINGLPAGNYSLTVTDMIGCTSVITATVTQPNALSISFAGNGGSCGSNGILTANVTGGVGPYQWSWNNGATTPTIINLAPGDFSVTITDANGCTNSTNTTVSAFPLMNLVVTAFNTTCNGTSDGMVTTSISNGSAPYQFLWSNNATTSSISNLSPGVYAVTVTDLNGCSSTGSATVFLGTGLNVSISSSGYVCTGGTGTASVVSMGGTPPYNWVWSNGQITQTATLTMPGTYSVTATDMTGCFGTASVNMQSVPAIAINDSVTHVSCYGLSDGNISVQITGGIPPYQYLWENGSDLPSRINVPSGQYTVTVSDEVGCTTSMDIAVLQPDSLKVALSSTPGGCDNSGTAAPSVSGGVSPHFYKWNTGDTIPALVNLPPGDYSLTVTDANGCSASGVTLVEFPPLLSCEVVLTQTVSQVGGNDGMLTSVVNGGSPPIQYVWDNGQTDETAFGLAPGEHFVTVTDGNQCVSSCSFTLLNPARTGDLVWEDTNMNGQQNANEPGMPDITVTISGTDAYGFIVNQTTQTDTFGKYFFIVQPGVYQLHFSKPAGYFPAPANLGSDDAIDSDASELTGMTNLFTLNEGEENLMKDAGFIPLPSCNNVTFAGTICCDQTICSEDDPIQPILQTSPAAGGIGNLEFQWFHSTVAGPFNPSHWQVISGANSSSYSPVNLTETTYFLRRVRRENCTDYLNSNIISVSLDTLPPVTIKGPGFVCTDTPADFTSSVQIPDAKYEWFFENGMPPTDSTPFAKGITWGTNGIKTIILTISRNGCSVSDTSTVNVSNDFGHCFLPLVITATKVGQRQALVEWDFPKSDSIIRFYQVEWAWESSNFIPIGPPDSTKEDNNLLSYLFLHKTPLTGRNFYRVKLEDSNGAFLYSNIEELIFRDSFNLVHVYPNPVSNILKVEIFDRFDAQVTFNLVVPDGKIVGTYQAPTDDSLLEIDMKNLPAGVYFLRVNYDGKLQKIYKLVKRSP